MTYRIRTIAVAIALAALAAVLTGFYVTNYKRHVDQRQDLVPVAIATHDIPAGTPGSLIVSKQLITVRQIARAAIVPGGITRAEDVQGLVAIQPTYAGEQVTARRFGPAAVEGIRSQLSGTFRAVRVSGTDAQLLLGIVRAGDHVDVVANVKIPDESSQKHFARVVLRDVPVLEVSPPNADSAKITNPNGGDGWLVLRLSDSQAHRMFFVTTNEDWTLALRPPLDDSDSPTTLSDAASVLTTGAQATDAARLAAARKGN